MARINTNIPSVIAQSNLARSSRTLETHLERLSTGLRINRGSDDPAGLITSERLRSGLAAVEQAVTNAERASSVIATTEAALDEVNNLLIDVRALIIEAANSGAISQEERDANQLQIDSAIDSITRISNTATFGDLRLLDGSLDYTLSGVDAGRINRARVLNASFTGSSQLDVEIDVVTSAQTGALYYNGGTTPAGQILSSVTLEIAGPRGVEVVTFPTSTPLGTVATAINNLSEATGVRASLINGDANSGLVFESLDFGSTSFVSVTRLNKPDNPTDDAWTLFRFPDGTDLPDFTGGFTWGSPLTAATRDTGQDVGALINGSLATGRGLQVLYSSSQLSVDLILDSNFATDPTLSNSTFQVTGGGALFQIGPEINQLQQVNLGVQSISASRLGGTIVNGTLQYLSSLKTGAGNSIDQALARRDFTALEGILATALDEVSVLRGRLGAFERNVLDTSGRSMQAAIENLSASASQIRDADFAFETSALTRAQILSSSGTTVLQLANAQSQQVLQLLG